MNRISVKIEKNTKGKDWVIADIHGCAKTLKNLILKQLLPTKHDRLFFLGDYVDRGVDSKGVLDFIIKLKEEGYPVFPLLGNHEQVYLEYNENDFSYMKWLNKRNKTKNLLDGEKLHSKYSDFFRSLPHFYELDDFYLVHGGFDFTKEAPFSDTQSMLWLRATKIDNRFVKNKTIICGHTVTYRQDIINAVKSRKQLICIDNGAYYTKKHKIYDHTQLGCLCALNLDTYELIFQKNIDNPICE